jgi:hypothetical protein
VRSFPLLRVVRPAAAHHARLEPGEDHARGLREAVARLVHVDLEAVVLHARQPVAHAEDRAALRLVVQQDHLLDHAQGRVPGQDHRARRERDALRAPGQVREDLRRVRPHRVPVEVVLDAPDRIEAERLGELGEPHVERERVLVRGRLEVVLQNQLKPDFHGGPPCDLGMASSCVRSPPFCRIGARSAW